MRDFSNLSRSADIYSSEPELRVLGCDRVSLHDLAFSVVIKRVQLNLCVEL